MMSEVKLCVCVCLCVCVRELYFWVKTPSMLHSADRGKLQEAEVSSSFPS